MFLAVRDQNEGVTLVADASKNTETGLKSHNTSTVPPKVSFTVPDAV